jgi:hypothetical protein
MWMNTIKIFTETLRRDTVKIIGFTPQFTILKPLTNWLIFNVVSRAFHQAFLAKLLTFGQRIFPVNRSSEDAPHHLMCLLLRKLD